jgi:hypothetical protein
LRLSLTQIWSSRRPVGPPSKSVLIGNNPDEAKGRFNTDLTGGLEEAKAIFESLTEEPVC